MDDNYVLFSDDDETEVFTELLLGRLRPGRDEYVARRNLLDLDDEEFKVRFRLSKSTVKKLHDLLRPRATRRVGTNAVSLMEKILITLRFYGSGSFLQPIGELIGLADSTVSRVVHEMSILIASMSRDFVDMPTNDELPSVIKGFYDMARFPNVIGALDCTQVKILNVGGPNAELFRNKQNYYSLKVKVVCDHELKIRNFVARHYGSTDDQTVLDASVLRVRLEHGEFGDGVLLGDSEYECTSYLLTPSLPATSPEQELYNKSHMKTHNTIERFFRVWKQRFPVLYLGMRFSVERVQAVIAACAVLHNLAVQEGEDVPPLPQDIPLDIPQDVPQDTPQDSEDDMDSDMEQEHGVDENYDMRNLMLEYFKTLTEEDE